MMEVGVKGNSDLRSWDEEGLHSMAWYRFVTARFSCVDFKDRVENANVLLYTVQQ